MPVVYTTITEEMLDEMYNAVQECETLEFASMFKQFRLYQENRLKNNEKSKESKKEARKGDGTYAKKMKGVIKLIAIEGAENTFKVEKVSIPAPAPVLVPVANWTEEEEAEDAEPLSAVAERLADVARAKQLAVAGYEIQDAAEIARQARRAERKQLKKQLRKQEKQQEQQDQQCESN